MSENELPLWAATIMRPRRVSASLLGDQDHVRQCIVYGRAKSRAAFARLLIASGLEHRSEAAVSAWLRDWGNGTSAYRPALEVVTEGGVFLASVNCSGGPIVPYLSGVES